MASVPTQNSYLDDYRYSQKPISPAEQDVESWETDLDEDSYGYSESSEYEGESNREQYAAEEHVPDGLSEAAFWSAAA